jgi:hypothetical protein
MKLPAMEADHERPSSSPRSAKLGRRENAIHESNRLLCGVGRSRAGHTERAGLRRSDRLERPVDHVHEARLRGLDRLTNNVWLTRGDIFPLFNIAVEPNYIGGSPSDTEWAFGPTQPGNPGPISASNHANLVFDFFILSLDRAIGRNAVPYGPGVLHLISDDIYLDIRFTSWTQEIGGGGFSYIRSTPTKTPVPEPSSATLLIVGAVAWLGPVAARRARNNAIAVRLAHATPRVVPSAHDSISN